MKIRNDKDTLNPDIVASRIALLRNKRGLSQEELASMISELTTREKPYSPQLVSAWESGRRPPTEEMIARLSHFFNVTEEYIRGLSDNPDTKASAKDSNKEMEIKVNELENFDGRPVFVAFKDLSHKDQFAIVNTSRKALIMRDGLLPFASSDIRAIYASESDYAYFMSKGGHYPVDMNTLLNSKNNLFYIEVTSSDPIVQGQYNGWYRRNANNTALINSIGLALPFEGLGISYNAYLKNDNTR